MKLGGISFLSYDPSLVRNAPGLLRVGHKICPWSVFSTVFTVVGKQGGSDQIQMGNEFNKCKRNFAVVL